MENETHKQATIDEAPLLVLVFDRASSRYTVNGGPWIYKGAPREDGKEEDILRCLRSNAPGHTAHCHWQAWNGAMWIDTMKECSGC